MDHANPSHHREFIRFQALGFWLSGKAVCLQLFMVMPKEQKEGSQIRQWAVCWKEFNLEDIDSKSLNAPSWQLESKLADSQRKPSTIRDPMCFSRLCVMAHVLLFGMESRFHKIWLFCVVRRDANLIKTPCCGPHPGVVRIPF
jgi:hypothetical protein